MSKRMLIDATHPEETRVVVLNGTKLEEFDFESSTKKQIKGNIYLARVTRVEPSLQAAFVEYGGNRHGFLAFSEIHPDYYQIPVSDREAMLAHEARMSDEDDEQETGRVDHGTSRDEDPGSNDTASSNDSARSNDEARTSDEPGSNDDASGYDGTDEAETRQTGEGLAPQSIYDSGEAISVTDEFAETTASEPVSGDDDDGVFVERSEASSTVETIGGDEMEEVATRRQRTPYRHYKIQEVIKRRQILLIQVTKEERGNKGAALTTYLSLAGRYCVLMPNAGRGGGVSRKITSTTDRRRLKELMEELAVPEGMGVIVRTAGSERSKAEIHRDYEYLLRLWDDIRELTLRSSAPALIYEEGSLIKRAIRDLYSRDIEEVLVEGEAGYRNAKDFMRMLMPSHASRVKSYRDPVIPLFHRFQIDQQIDQIHNPTVQLRSGGYIVINPTEALVAIDVNSGRSTRERNIEETATKTNLEAADEVARQLRLRDLAGLIVIDFIDMEESRNRGAVERRLKDAMKNDRARIQLGRVSPFGLLELSRQRLRPSLIEASTQICPHCTGTGTIRSTESTALVALRALEEEGIRRRTAEITLWVPTHVALYILNQKRDGLRQIEQRYGFAVTIQQDDELIPPAYRLDRVRAFTPSELSALPVPSASPILVDDEPEDFEIAEDESGSEGKPESGEAAAGAATPDSASASGRRRRRRRRGRGQGGREGGASGEGQFEAGGINQAGEEAGDAEEYGNATEQSDAEVETVGYAKPDAAASPDEAGGDAKSDTRRRRRGRRGGRRHAREERPAAEGEAADNADAEQFGGYGPAEDFARDDRPFLYGATDTPDITPVDTDLVVEVAADAVAAVETPAVEAPTKRRAPRRRKDSEDTTSKASAPDSSSDDAGAEAPAAKPRARRKKAATEPAAEAVATAVVAPEAVVAEPVVEIVPTEAVSAPEPAVEPQPAPMPEPVPEPVPVEAIVAEAETPAVPEAQPVAAPPAAEVIIVGESTTAEPSRKGWWRRLI